MPELKAVWSIIVYIGVWEFFIGLGLVVLAIKALLSGTYNGSSDDPSSGGWDDF